MKYDPNLPPPKPEQPVHPLRRPPPPQAERPEPPQQRIPVPRVDIPRSQPVLSYLILGINVIIFGADVFLSNNLTYHGAKINELIIAGEYWRLVTPIFLHGNLLHLFFNNYFLYMVGPQIERQFGYLRFLALYMLSGIAGTIASFMFVSNPSIGASGAIFGLLGVMVAFLYLNREVLSGAQARIKSIGRLIAMNLVIGLTPGIDNWAHTGGLLAGLALSLLTAPRYKIASQMPDLVRIEDTSSPALTWVVYVLFFGGLVGLTGLIIFLRTGGLSFLTG